VVQEVSRESVGRRGELAALVVLTLKGYRLRHRNWRGPSGELDLVVERRGELVFVEVKMRRGELFGGAAAAVDRDKQGALVRTAAAYLSRYGLWDRPSSFDVVTIERRTRLPFWRIRHLRNAFQPNLGRSF
jgi:putative endonuclease